MPMLFPEIRAHIRLDRFDVLPIESPKSVTAAWCSEPKGQLAI